MFTRDDTIAAIATPAGRGGLGVVRVSGSDSLRVVQALRQDSTPLLPRRATFGRVRGAAAMLDQAVFTYFEAPHSYTGEHVVEISAHGSQIILQGILQALVDEGARLAEPGEFTLRAFLNGRVDLVQAEAVRDLVDAVTPIQARAAFDQLEGTLTHRIAELDARLLDVGARLEASMDFPEEGYHFIEPGGAASELREIAGAIAVLLEGATHGRLVREGAQVVIVGRPNSGKSSLFNRLAGADRAIVTDVPGTTRDLVTELVQIEELAVTLVDTAGLRPDASDAVEIEGMARTRSAGRVADLTLVVLDSSAPLSEAERDLLAETADRARVVVLNKCDLPAAETDVKMPAVRLSALTGEGIGDLRRAIASALLNEVAPARDVPAITNMRHIALLERACAALNRAAAAAETGTPEEFVALDVTDARGALEEVTGARTPDDVLRVIFEKFCIGK